MPVAERMKYPLVLQLIHYADDISKVKVKVSRDRLRWP
jgi:hypothetical protein